MIARTSKTWVWLGAFAAGLVPTARQAEACAVCFGDPDSPMAKGIVWGVLVLISVVGFVLVAIAATGFVWMRRSRRLADMEPGEEFTRAGT